MKRKTLLIIFILTGVIILFLGSYFIFKMKNKSNNEIQIKENVENSEKNNINNNNLENEKESQNQDKENSNESTIKDDQKADQKDDKPIKDGSNKNNTSKDNTTSNNDLKEDVTNNDKTNNETASKYELKKLGNLQYYLYTPSNPTNNMPLIMYLHGGTNKKLDAKALLTTDGFPKYLYDGYYGNFRAYVVIPKLASNYSGWINVSEQLRNLIKEMNVNYKIDLNKVSLTGHSMGGTGTYQVQTKLSNTFACIAPMSGSIKNTEENINALSKTKIWAFVGTEDTIVKPDSTRTIIATLKENGVNAKITELAGATHFDVPSLGYKNSEFINWLVNCTK